MDLERTRRQLKEVDRERWRADPVLYAEERLGIVVWDKLAEILYSVRDNYKTYCYSANGVGKTEMAAIVPLWWLESFDPSAVLITGSSWATIKDTVLPRIRRNVRASKILGEDDPNKTEIWLADDHYLTSRSTRIPENIAGIHSPHLLQVVEESSGIGYPIAAAIDGNDTGMHGRQLYLGNPREPSGPFHEGIKERKGHVIKISAFDHPNVIEGREVVPGAIGREKVVQRLKDFKCQKCDKYAPDAVHIFWKHIGPDGNEYDEQWYSPTVEYGIRVLSEFPKQSANSLLSELTIADAAKREMISMEPRALGCDVARFGSDETVITLANDFGIIEQICVNGKSTDWTEDKIKFYKAQYPSLVIAVDDTGVGGGIVDQLRKANIEVIPINFGANASKADKYKNAKAEIYWNFKEQLESGYSIPDDEVLKQQLLRLKYKYTTEANSRIQIISKEEYKSDYGDSPDRAESAFLAFHACRFSPPIIATPRMNREQTDRSSGQRYKRTVWGD